MARNEDIERIIAERERSRPSIGAHDPRFRPLDGQRTTVPAWIASKMPTGAARDTVRAVTHGLGQTGTTLLRFLDIPNRVFGNTRSRLQDIYESAERNMARDEFEDKSGAPQVGATAVHLASMGAAGRALPAVFGANVGADTYETARYAGASEGEAFAKGVGHGVVDTAIWTLGQGLVSKYLPKAWQWLGREIIGAGRGAASSVASDAVLNSLGADISGEEMAERAVHAAWMVPLLGMLKMGKGSREKARAELKRVRPDLAGERVDKVIETLENEFSDPRSQKVALAWVARKGANLPDDLAQIHQAIEVANKVKGVDFTQKSPFEIISDPAYARYLPKPRPQDVKAFSNMKRYPMGVIGFDVSDDAAGRQAVREMINAYMSPLSNPWCLATGKGAAKLGGLGPDAEGYWKSHSAVPKQIFFQEVDGKLELTAFRATSPGGEGRQEYWDTSDAGYSGIPIKVKVPGDSMGRYRKMVFRPAGRGSEAEPELTPEQRTRMEAQVREDREHLASIRRDGLTPRELEELDAAGEPVDAYVDYLQAQLELRERALSRQHSTSGEVQGTFEDIAPGKIFKGDPFRDGRSQTWVIPSLEDPYSHRFSGWVSHRIESDPEYRQAQDQFNETGDTAAGERMRTRFREIKQDAVRIVDQGEVLIEDKVRTTENGITKFRTTKYADPTDRNYEPPKPGEAPKPVEIEESELVSPEWMRSRGYDPESESDVRRMQHDLNIQAWGNGREAAMAVVPTKRTYMQTKSGTPETVTYGPNGRAIMAVDFVKDGVPYKEEYDYAGPNWDMESPDDLYPGDSFYQLPRPEYGVSLTAGAVNRRLIRNPGTERAEVLDDVRVDEGLGGFVRTSGNRRWRMTDAPVEAREGPELFSRWIDAERSYRDVEARFAGHYDDAALERMYTMATAARNTAHQEYLTWARQHPNLTGPNGMPSRTQPRLLTEDRQPDGTWAPAVDRIVNAETGEVVELPPPPPAVRTADTRTAHERMMDEFDRNGGDIPRGLLMGDDEFVGDDEIEAARNQYHDEMEEAYVRHIQGLPELRVPRRPHVPTEPGVPAPPGPPEPFEEDDVPLALKAGRTRRNVRAAEGGGDAGPETVVSETPVSEAPQNPGGPRIVINPQVFHDKRDALCVAFNEAIRVVCEMTGFEPVSEPTEKQRRFFADTAYANDELQLRRTILARIATLDTSVSDPTDEQLEETAEMLEMVMEVGAPQNEWEQQAVQRLHDVVVKAREGRAQDKGEPLPPEP